MNVAILNVGETRGTTQWTAHDCTAGDYNQGVPPRNYVSFRKTNVGKNLCWFNFCSVICDLFVFFLD